MAGAVTFFRPRLAGKQTCRPKTVGSGRRFIALLCLVSVKSQSGGFSGGDSIIRQEQPNTETEAQGFLHAVTGINLNDLDILKNAQVRVGGAAAAGITYNPASPTDRSNFPVAYNDRSNEFQFNRFRLFAQRDMNVDRGEWDVGGRLDFVIGADARYVTAAGLDDKFTPENRFIKMAVPQFTLQFFAPFGQGISAQVGHFLTIIGSTSPFYSISYSAYSEPASHTGALFTTSVGDNLSVSAGPVLGTVDTLANFGKNLGIWNFLGSATWAKDDTTLAVSLLTGDDTSYAEINGLGKRQSRRTHASIVLNRDIAEKWHYKLQHDVGYQEIGFNAKPAHWYGIEQDLLYDATSQLSAGLRAEWFRDQDGLKISADGKRAAFYSITAGLFWKPMRWFTLRPEVRYDISNNPVYNDLTDRRQFTFAASFVIRL